jgi:hypothetical protein
MVKDQKQQKMSKKDEKNTGQIILNTIIIILSLAIIAIIIALFVLLFQKTDENQPSHMPTHRPTHLPTLPPDVLEKIKNCIKCVKANKQEIIKECKSPETGTRKDCFIAFLQKNCKDCQNDEIHNLLSNLTEEELMNVMISCMTKSETKCSEDLLDMLG